MRVAYSHPAAGIGLAVLAALGLVGQQQQAKSVGSLARQVRPIEQITVEPVLFAWDDLVKLQASLPESRVVSERPITIMPELAPIEISSQVLEGEVATSGSRVDSTVLCPGFASEPTLGKAFDAQLDVPDGAAVSYIPPDVAGSVGPDHLMVMLNNKVLIQDRLGGSVSSVDTSVFWSPLGASPSSPSNLFHRVNYDSLDGRWVASCKNGAPATSTIFFAISATSDPTGVWTYYSFAADSGAAQQADWVLHGYNQEWIVITADMFNLAGTTFFGPKAWAIDKSTALAGGPLTVTVFATGYVAAATGVAGSSRFMPSRAFDTSDTDVYILAGSSFSSGGEFIHQWVRVSGTGPAPMVAPVGPTLFSPATSSFYLIAPGVSFASAQHVMSQLDDARTMNPFFARIASVVLRNGRVWAAQSGGLPGPAGNTTPTRTGIMWYELDPAAMPSPVVQSGTIDAGLATASIIPSIAVNCGNDVVVGFSNGDSTMHARACYAVRLGTDPLDTMGPIRTLGAGESSYWKNFGVGSPTICAWGRWSAATVDPVDDKTFWTVQQYADTRVGPLDNDSRWGTRWGRIGSCGAPTIDEDPEPRTVCMGEPVTFSVSATAFVAPLAYQWRKDTVPIPGANASSYSIPSTVVTDGGVYDVIVEDGCGNVTSLDAMLGFSTGAVVIVQPQNQTVTYGSTASFSVSAKGAGKLTYEWRKDGVSIVPAETSSTLTITYAGRKDIGVYDCIVSDACAPTLSDSAVLTIEPGAAADPIGQGTLELTISEQPESGVLCVGNDGTLQVKAHGQRVTYLWRKDTFPIVPPETSDTLAFSSVDAGDAGTYDCLVSDASGSLVTDPAVIVVHDRPTITAHPSNVEAHIGDSASFGVSATGDHILTFQWKKGGFVGPLFEIPGKNDPVLTIHSIDESDFGQYQCAVTNWCGTSLSDTATLTEIP